VRGNIKRKIDKAEKKSRCHCDQDKPAQGVPHNASCSDKDPEKIKQEAQQAQDTQFNDRFD
jgi:hypothetical protein